MERDIGACSVYRNDRGVLVSVGIGAVPGFVGGDGGRWRGGRANGGVPGIE